MHVCVCFHAAAHVCMCVWFQRVSSTVAPVDAQLFCPSGRRLGFAQRLYSALELLGLGQLLAFYSLFVPVVVELFRLRNPVCMMSNPKG
jgi:hypothetical protein